MNRSVRQACGFARKAQGGRSPAHGLRLSLVATNLAAKGVPTPPASYDKDTHEIVSPWINGLTAREILRQRPKVPATPDDPVLTQIGEALMVPLQKLHGTDPFENGLRRFDPWALIAPRLELPHNLQAKSNILANRLRLMESVLLSQISRPWVTVHGDLHVGQIILAPDDIWLLDLDDLAAGWFESDLANFSAHIASSRDLFLGNIFSGFIGISRGLSTQYTKRSGIPVQSILVSYYGALALLRRSLKLAIQDGCGVMAQQVFQAALRVTDQLRQQLDVNHTATMDDSHEYYRY